MRRVAKIAFLTLYAAVLALYIGKAVELSWAMVDAGQLIHGRETIENVIPLTLHQGGNPFSLEHEPAMFSAYGPLFYLLAAPFSPTLAQARHAERLLGVLSALAFPLVFCMCVGPRRRFDPLVLTAGFFATFFIYLSNECGSKPGNLAMLLAFVGLAYPWRTGFRTGHVLLGLLAGTAAAFMKSFFVFSPLLLLAYLFCFVSKRRAGICLAAFAGMAAALILVLEALWPNSCSSTVYTSCFLQQDIRMLVFNLTVFGSQFCVLALVLLFLLGHLALRRAPKDTATPGPVSRLDLRNGDVPLLGFRLDYPLYLLLATALGYCLTLGQHMGNKTVYLSQMVMPSLLWWMTAHASELLARRSAALGGQTSRWRYALLGAFTLQTILLYPLLDNMVSVYTADRAAPWEKLESYLDYAGSVMGNRMTAHLLLGRGRSPLQYGQTEFARYSDSLRYPGWKDHCLAYFDQRRQEVAAGRYDLIVLLRGRAEIDNAFVDEGQVLHAGYALLTRFPVDSVLYSYTMYLYVRAGDLPRWRERFGLG